MTIFGKSCPGFFWGTEKLMMFDFWGGCGKQQTFNLKMLMNLLISINFPNNINFMVTRYFGTRWFRIVGMPELIIPVFLCSV